MDHNLTGPVVVGVGFAHTPSDAAIAYGVWEAERQHRELLLLHGYDEFDQLGVPPITGYHTWMVNEARARMAEIQAKIEADHPSLNVSHHVRRSSGAPMLIDASETASLVVVESRGHGMAFDVLAGSVAAQVAAHVRCPMVVVRPTGADGKDSPEPDLPGPGPVLVGIDGSTYSTQALRFAVAEADRRGVPLVATAVWTLQDLSELGAELPWDEDAAAWEDRMEEDCRRVLAEALAGAAENYPDQKIEPLLVHDITIFQGLITAGRQVGASLTVVGSRGVGGFTGLLLGSVSQSLVSHGPGTVALVPHQSSAD